MTFLATPWFGVPVAEIGIASGVALAAYLGMSLVLRFAHRRLRQLAQHTTNRADDMLVEVLESTRPWLIALAALLIGVGTLSLSDRWDLRVGQLWFAVLALQLGLWSNTAVTVGRRSHVAVQEPGVASPAGAAATLLSWALRVLIWTVVLLAVLSNVGVNITAFVASLGVGGIAVALAAQNILGDLFASVAIALDKPFEVGDFIVLGSVSGTVERVGVKTTRIRSLGGEQVVMSNTELLKQTVSNYKRLRERRIVFGFGVTYGTTPAQAEAIPGAVRRVVEASERLRFDRAHFKAFGESSLDYEVVYHVLNADYGTYMDEQQRVNLALMRELSELGVDFAFPTRTVVMAAST
ncbi:mechanosensitive ion channel family protein [Roseateles sp. LYH14W]|uniref:Mechanosensitive ion channel family protein n=1 Tax=Pelomonas parva TaxID=3299032 RepID=A0ABW7EVN0_9BURK